MSWKIDRDYLACDGIPSRVGQGEQLSPETLPTVRFRLLDDDGEVYYGGWLHDDLDGDNQFAALRFGLGDAGATEIQVKRNGEWVTEIG